MKKENLEYRMYFLLLYSLSDIQKGIQAMHSCIEYSLKYEKDKDYQKWSNIDKTVILLSGGTTNDNDKNLGSLQEHINLLKENNIKFAEFREPDLNNSLVSIAILVPEQVYNKIKYPDYINHEQEYKSNKGIIGLSSCDIFYNDMEYNIWLKNIGGEQNAFLRDFLKNFKLA